MRDVTGAQQLSISTRNFLLFSAEPPYVTDMNMAVSTAVVVVLVRVAQARGHRTDDQIDVREVHWRNCWLVANSGIER